MHIADGTFGLAVAIAGLLATFGAAWLLALLVGAGGAYRVAALAATVLGATLGSVALTRLGASAPVMLLLLALPLESWWVDRRKQAARFGAAASLVALASAWFGGIPSADTSVFAWLSAMAYVAALAYRWRPVEREAARSAGVSAVAIPQECLDAAVLVLGRSGEVEQASETAQELLGVDPALLLGNGFGERLHVADRVGLLHAVGCTRDDGLPRRVHTRCRMPLGADGYVSYRAFDIEIVSPRHGVVWLIVRSGAERTALLDELDQARESAKASDLAKGRFLAAVSHELRTPLNAIIGFSEMLLHPDVSGPLDKPQSEKVTLIREAGGHLLSVVNSILDMSKIEAGSYHLTIEPFSLASAVQLCSAMLEPQARARDVAITTRIPATIGEVAGDQRAVQQIVINLLSNAIKFTPEGGRIAIEATRKDSMIRLTVSDTGIGMASDDLQRIGQPFVQVRNDYTRQFQGTGLGLSLVKGLVELHKGTMSIESAPDLGTTVTIGLPAAKPADVADRDDADMTQDGSNGSALRKIA